MAKLYSPCPICDTQQFVKDPCKVCKGKGFLQAGITDSQVELQVSLRKSAEAEAEAWEGYRIEMKDAQARMGELGANFFKLKAYDEAAKCAMKADSLSHLIGRMPKRKKERARDE